MKSSQPTNLSRIFAASRLWALLFGVFTYSVGAGIHHFLGGAIDWVNFWLGLGCTTLLQASGYLLKAYYDWLDPAQRFQSGGVDRETILSMRAILFQTVAILLTVGAVLTALLFVRGTINLTVLFIIGFAFLLAFFYAVPPLRLVYSGYGELVEAFLVATLIPALAFLLQTGSLHRLLAMLAFPIAGLYLAMLLVFDLQEYGQEIKTNRRDMLYRIGWQKGMTLHNVLILAAYLLIGGAAVLGLPWNLAWPALLTFPIGLLQIYQIIQISNGVPPRWRLIRLIAAALPGIMAYLFIVALWTS